VNNLADARLDRIYLAGERVPSGRYREIDTKREILLETNGYLPASLDGRVAAYTCIQQRWEHAPRSDQESLNAKER
jgi:hypothetical protein